MMKRIRIAAGLVLLSLLLAACQSAGTPASTAGTGTGTATPVGAAPLAATAYPADEQNPAPQSADLSGAYPILPGDENKAGGSFYADQYELDPNASDPAKTDLIAVGSLPTPCNEIRAFVNPPNEKQEIFVRVYSVADKDKVCTQVLQPFEGVVTTLTGFPAGKYIVYANDQQVGEVILP